MATLLSTLRNFINWLSLVSSLMYGGRGRVWRLAGVDAAGGLTAGPDREGGETVTTRVQPPRQLVRPTPRQRVQPAPSRPRTAPPRPALTAAQLVQQTLTVTVQHVLTVVGREEGELRGQQVLVTNWKLGNGGLKSKSQEVDNSTRATKRTFYWFISLCNMVRQSLVENNC